MAVKYYSDDWPTNNSKLAFEKFVFSKTLKTNARTEGKQQRLRNTHCNMKLLDFLSGASASGDGYINLR